ncbi:DNA mismatch repair protein Msh2-like isoform X2 [Xenia sp. Carnegie-2017]|uniref:DNA mismatch repair protein Msh2-like isoform X2 n=1 Tax=Xenia sp. Carnegie-2017 TaxID=2897299 RepID=UPI001F03BFC1|nr:DNA mismatch repair protein Msh2-like isoform X2 [Xenia sp. Carnegie-2017]
MAAQTTKQAVLDVPYEQTFLLYLNSLPKKSETTIRVFDRNEYYTVHGNDATFIAKEIIKSLNIVKHIGAGETKMPSIALSKPKFESTIRELLLVRQYRVEMYQNKGGKGAKQNWFLAGKASPGNLQQFEDILFGNNEMSSSVAVMAFKLIGNSNQKVLGAACIDVSERSISVCEIADDDQFSNVEALLVQMGPKECIIQANDKSADAVKLEEVIKRSGILITKRKKGDFSSIDIVQDLNRLLKNNPGDSSALPEVDLKQAMECVAVIIKYLEVLSDESNFGRFRLSTIDLSQHMKLDAAAVHALNILPSSTDGSKSMCLMNLLNKCRSPQGKRLLGQWIKQPLLDEQRIGERLNITEAFVNNVLLRQTVQEELRRFLDFSRMAKKFQKSRATLKDCVRVYQAVARIQELVTGLEECNDEHQPLITEVFIIPLQELMQDFTKYNELIETTIDFDQIENQEFLIKPSFDEALQECRESMDQLQQKIPRELNKAASELGLEAGKTIKLETSNQLGYFLRITRKEEKKLRGKKPYITLETKKDGVRFTTSVLRRINEEFRVLKNTYDDVQSKLADEVLKVAGGYGEPMQILSDVLAKLDVLVSFAHVAACAPIPYCRPKILPKEQGLIELKACRHPCLEVQDDVSFIPNDVILKRDEQYFLIITGPNMGGKSTYIRSVSVAVLMAQIGCFVPCEEASISIRDATLARVGSSDNQVKGVSTFMSEMLETSSILRIATENSLIIIDELGRGTSTYDGFGLAWAISEYISTRIKAPCLFATHFHELTALADVVPTVRNYHVTAMATDNCLTLLYRIKPGVCDQSFGIHVAELTNFPLKVIEFAKRKAIELEDFQDQTGNFTCDVDEEKSLAKKRRSDKKEGDKMIYKYLQSVAALPIDDLTDLQVSEQFASFKQDLLEKNNSYVTAMLSRNIEL